MQLAVNVPDLSRNPPFVVSALVGNKIDPCLPAEQTDASRLDEFCTPFVCDLLTAAATADVLRTADRNRKRYPTRAYLRTKRAWKKLSGSSVLAVVRDGKVVLNPEVFGEE